MCVFISILPIKKNIYIYIYINICTYTGQKTITKSEIYVINKIYTTIQIAIVQIICILI